MLTATTRPATTGSHQERRNRLAIMLSLWLVLPTSVGAQAPPPILPPESSGATTEHACTFGMPKGESGQRCQVPIPPGCVVAHRPGSSTPWATISKGGNTQCRFDEKATDWKTRIVGTCGPCKSTHCSAQFIVRFDCSSRK
jgi:hypothetical protein